MDLRSLLRREENFFEVYFLSIQRLFKTIYDFDVELSLTNRISHADLVIYPRLSAAASKNISSKAKDYYFSEWNIRGNRIKRILSKAYVFVALNSFGLLAQYKISARPAKAIGRDIVIAPNNRSIRVFDYSSDVVSCIVKNGFTKKYFSNQIQFRKAHNYDFVLPLIKDGDDWFVEPILHGHPLARVSDEALYNRSINDAICKIGRLAHDTKRTEHVDNYAKALKEYLLSRLAEVEKRKQIHAKDELGKLICTLAKPLEDAAETEITLVISHGDFQSGNIWVEPSGKVWLYDWETVEERSVWYDAVTLMLSTRRAGGLEKLWSERTNSETMAVAVLNDDNKDCSPKRSELVARVVLLEEIKFYLDDMLELPSDWGREIFVGFCNRLRAMEINEE